MPPALGAVSHQAMLELLRDVAVSPHDSHFCGCSMINSDVRVQRKLRSETQTSLPDEVGAWSRALARQWACRNQSQARVPTPGLVLFLLQIQAVQATHYTVCAAMWARARAPPSDYKGRGSPRTGDRRGWRLPGAGAVITIRLGLPQVRAWEST